MKRGEWSDLRNTTSMRDHMLFYHWAGRCELKKASPDRSRVQAAFSGNRGENRERERINP